MERKKTLKQFRTIFCWKFLWWESWRYEYSYENGGNQSKYAEMIWRFGAWSLLWLSVV